MATVWLVLSLAALPAIGQKSDPFYSTLVEDGIRAYQRGQYLRASEELRIATFGLLGTPEELARALVFLALAQSAGGDREGFERSYARLTEIESRFRAYSSAALSGDARSALELAARAQLGNSDLAPESVTAPARTTGAQSSSRPQLCISWGGDGECQQVNGIPEARRPDSPAGDTPGPEQLVELDQLEQLASTTSSNRELRQGLDQASALADRYPDWAEMQRVAAVLASRSGRFADAMVYYERAGEQADDGPLQLFYRSVALFETDQPEAAAMVLRRALPGLEQNREVRRYVRLILSREDAG